MRIPITCPTIYRTVIRTHINSFYCLNPSQKRFHPKGLIRSTTSTLYKVCVEPNCWNAYSECAWPAHSYTCYDRRTVLVHIVYTLNTNPCFSLFFFFCLIRASFFLHTYRARLIKNERHLVFRASECFHRDAICWKNWRIPKRCL